MRTITFQSKNIIRMLFLVISDCALKKLLDIKRMKWYPFSKKYVSKPANQRRSHESENDCKEYSVCLKFHLLICETNSSWLVCLQA